MRDAVDAPAARRRGPNGFTLIELLIVVVVLGILAIISIQGLEGYRRRALSAAVKTDLRNAMAAEEGYFSDYGAYTAFSVADGGSVSAPDFTASQQVSITGTLVGSGIRIEGSHAATSETWCISTVSGKVVEGSGC